MENGDPPKYWCDEAISKEGGKEGERRQRYEDISIF